ncbi:MAG: hypothetical protein ABSF79_12195 [Smithellaceae bacterium]
MACLVFLSEEKAADHDVSERVIRGADAGKFKIEVVERTRIAIAGLPGEPIGHGEVRAHLVLFDGARAALVAHVRILTYAEPQAPESGRIMSRKHGFELASKGKKADPRGW